MTIKRFKVIVNDIWFTDMTVKHIKLMSLSSRSARD